MNIYRVSFIGHRQVDDHGQLEERLTAVLTDLLRTRNFIEFQIGRSGEFDIFTASCIKRIQSRHGTENSAITLVLPYPVADVTYYEAYYDGILIPEEARTAHPKRAITERNRWLVDHADLLVAYVHRNTGGAATCLKMAEQAGRQIIRV